MKTFTLEWNAVITWETEGRIGRESLGQLVSMHGTHIDVGIVTTAASENTAVRGFPETAAAFDDRLKAIGWDSLSKVLTVAVWDLTYFDYCFWANDDAEDLLKTLWSIITPVNLPYSHSEFAAQFNISRDIKITAPPYYKWRNKWCDVHSLYAHIIAGRDIFVSGDVKNFRGEKAQRLRELGVSQICSYDEALAIAQKKI
jgi:hypothetical protein